MGNLAIRVGGHPQNAFCFVPSRFDVNTGSTSGQNAGNNKRNQSGKNSGSSPVHFHRNMKQQRRQRSSESTWKKARERTQKTGSKEQTAKEQTKRNESQRRTCSGSSECPCMEPLLMELTFVALHLLEDLTWTCCRWGPSLGWSSRRLFHLRVWIVMLLVCTHAPQCPPFHACVPFLLAWHSRLMSYLAVFGLAKTVAPWKQSKSEMRLRIFCFV